MPPIDVTRGTTPPEGHRHAPLDMDPELFRELGHAMVDRLAEFLRTLPQKPVTRNATPTELRGLLGDTPVPENGASPGIVLEDVSRLLFDHSLFNGHPRFWGYITSSAAPIGALGDFLAATINPNVGGWPLSPIATEIERQTVKWIAELIGYPSDCGGLLVSGGNMANFVGFLAARKARAGWNIRAHGAAGDSPLRVYASEETHTWIQKAADLFGLGTDSIRWIPTDDRLRLDTGRLVAQIEKDRRAGDRPLLVVGTAGSVSTGAIDPLPAIASICRDHGLWFHVDGAYGGVAAVLPEAPADLKGLRLADSVAVDPHKWLYAPIEAGCTLVREPAHLLDAFSYRPPYYHLKYESADPETNYFECGPQNTRGFRALKVWLGLKQAGRQGYVTMIRDDIRLAGEMHRAAAAHPEFETFHHELSISTFRYVPRRLSTTRGEPETEAWLNRLNTELLTAIHASGELYLTNAVIDGRFVLRACVVNFRTSRADVEAVPSIVARLGAAVDERLTRES